MSTPTDRANVARCVVVSMVLTTAVALLTFGSAVCVKRALAELTLFNYLEASIVAIVAVSAALWGALILVRARWSRGHTLFDFEALIIMIIGVTIGGLMSGGQTRGPRQDRLTIRSACVRLFESGEINIVFGAALGGFAGSLRRELATARENGSSE